MPILELTSAGQHIVRTVSQERPPGALDDSTVPFEPGDRWVDTRVGWKDCYVCVSNVAGNAVWTNLTASGGGSTPTPTPPSGAAAYSKTIPLGTTAFPLSDAAAAALVRRHTWEPRDYTRPTPGSGGIWGPSGNITNLAANAATVTGTFPTFTAQGQTGSFKDHSPHPRAQQRAMFVTGRCPLTNPTPTTDELIQWACFKWGLNEDWTRAMCVNESGWWQDAQGDWAAACSLWQSHGILQIRNRMSDCVTISTGGYPSTRNSTALNLDFAHFSLRAYFEGWYEPWAIEGGTTQMAVGSEFYARGFYYNPGKTDAEAYSNKILNLRAQRPWTDASQYKTGYPWPVVPD